MSTCNRYQCSPVFFPCHISEEIEHPCLQFSCTLNPSSGPTEWGPIPLCQDISLTPAILLVLLHAGVSAAEDSIEKVLAKKKAEEEQGTLELIFLGNFYLPIATDKVGGGEGFWVTPPISPKLQRYAVWSLLEVSGAISELLQPVFPNLVHIYTLQSK